MREYKIPKIRSQDDVNQLIEAVDLLESCEDLADELENANYHSLMDSLREMVEGLHVHSWTGDTVYASDGSYEVECSVSGCYHCKWVEA